MKTPQLESPWSPPPADHGVSINWEAKTISVNRKMNIQEFLIACKDLAYDHPEYPAPAISITSHIVYTGDFTFETDQDAFMLYGGSVRSIGEYLVRGVMT